MNAYLWHDQLHSRYRIAGQLLVKTPLRISSGVASDETDAPFILDSAKRPYVPGTSLRGAVRAELERVIGGVGSSCGLKTCTLLSDTDCSKALGSAHK
jgi:CRISPR/Cas system CSM-associated protein Csm3 (group 7 of RAMP superfamily)